LEVYTTGGNPDTVAGDFGRQPLYKMMGYFSLVGLLRLHSLLGDFHQAIKVHLKHSCTGVENPGKRVAQKSLASVFFNRFYK
jgi:hypothetical protein